MNDRTEKLKDALSRAQQREISPKWRQRFHLMPPVGWLNDPNGLCCLNGEYHIFFQYSPFDVKPGTNFWGHYTTMDFVNYTLHEPALCCDMDFDKNGVYSGSAYIENGEMYLYYTGNVKHEGDYDYISAGREHNTVLVKSGDGRKFSEKNVLMRNSDYPADVTCHVRDPKVWKDKDEYLMLLGARRSDDVGEVLLYSSADKYRWTLKNRIGADMKLGYMWECPDYVELNGKKFLIFSPQGVQSDGMRFNNVYQTGCCEVHGDIKGSCALSEFDELDRGFDFYAPQSFVDEKGRRIQTAWLGLPDIEYKNPTSELGWVHCLTLPCELYEKNGKLCRRPIEELKTLRRAKTAPEKADVFEALACDIDVKDFTIRIKNDCIITYRDKVLSLEFKDSGYGRDIRQAKVENIGDIRIFCDSSSVEIFVNDGETVFSSRFYPNENERGIFCDDLDMTVWEMGKFAYSEGE